MSLCFKKIETQDETKNMITVSFVIPLFNEEERIEKTFRALETLRMPRGLKLEKIIFVDDGSTDKTFQKILEFSQKREKKHAITIISYKENRGKGNAVRMGMLESNSEYTLFFDADISTPLVEITKFAPFMHQRKPVLIGTRKNGKSTVINHQPVMREFMGKCFTLLTQTVLGLDVNDFTCGFKAFSKDAKEIIFSKMQISGWGYDAELMLLAQQNKFKIKEIPVIWSNDTGTKVVLYKAIPKSIFELIKINWIHKTKPASMLVFRPLFFKIQYRRAQ